MNEPKVITLPEYKSVRLPAAGLPYEVGRLLYRHYRNQINVEFPSPVTEDQWQLTNQGWVGHIPLTEAFHFALVPKVPIGNLFGMLEYAYRLESFRLLDGEIASDTLNELYERLANILAKRVLDRGRKGFHRAYIPEEDRLPYVRGRLNLQNSLTRPWDVSLDCHYQEHTADIEDNQLLAWALFRIAHGGVCTERVLPTVRRAYRNLQNLTTLTPFSPEACIHRLYHRLNEDYKPMHGLARFFLEQSGPGHQLGDRTMIPFVVDMARLYELFVAEWLQGHLPEHLRLRPQHKVVLDEKSGLHFAIDLLIEDAHTGATLYVLDTKYKTAGTAATDDVSQIIAYAQTQGAPEGVLVYPVDLAYPLVMNSHGIRLRSLTFSLHGNLETAGNLFKDTLLKG